MNQADLDPPTRWALAAQAGDAQAMAAFVRATQAEVWRFTAAIVDAGHADDLTQETYLRAFRSLPRFEARSSVRTWLLGIARRVCVDHLRATIRRRKLENRLQFVPDTHPDPAGQVSAVAMLASLSVDRREAFALTQLLGFSYEQAAAVLDVPVGTIRSRVARARADLAADLVTAMAA